MSDDLRVPAVEDDRGAAVIAADDINNDLLRPLER